MGMFFTIRYYTHADEPGKQVYPLSSFTANFDLEKAQKAQDSIVALQRVFKFGNPNTIIKKGVAMMGYPVGDCRRPFNYLCDEGIEELKKVLEETKDLG